MSSDSYSEILLAPTGRGKCKQTKEVIEVGTLKWINHYTPKGRNHMESAGYKLTSKSKTTLEFSLKKFNGKIESVTGFDILPEHAQKTAKRIVEAILSDNPISDDDMDFRCVPEKKPRAAKSKRLDAPAEEDGEAPTKKR